MNPYSPINIMLADDHELFRDGFRSLINEEAGIRLVAEAGDGYTLLAEVARFQPDVVVIDIEMPGCNGIKATELLTARYPQVAVIALSMSCEDHHIIDMLVAGAKGYVLKDAGKKIVLEAIFAVYKGQTFFCPAANLIRSRLIANGIYDPNRNERTRKLSGREVEVLRLLCYEKTNPQIAKALNITIRTVEGVRQKIRIKTDAANLIGMYRYAVYHGIIKDPDKT